MNKLAYYTGYMEKQAKTLKPGIYIGSRDVTNSPVGRHQFLVLVPKNAHKFKSSMFRNFGKGKRGIILSAFNSKGNLSAGMNYRTDLKALRGRFKGKNKFNTELQRLWFKDKWADRLVRKALKKHKIYQSSTRKDPIDYPTLGLGINSNSFVQAFRRNIGGKMYKDFKGFNVGGDKKLPNTRFQKEALELDLDVGDVVLGGRYKNKREVVKSLGTDELGQYTVNGKKLLSFRIEKKLPKTKWSKKTLEMKKIAFYTGYMKKEDKPNE